MKLLIVTLLLLALSTKASDREPPGSKTSAIVDSQRGVVTYSNNVSGSNWTLKINYPAPPITLPHIYKDADSAILFYVESDGRHVTAIDADGKILWTRDPFADAHLEFYRTHTPKIVRIQKLETDEPHKWIRNIMERKGITNFVCIGYNSSQSGCLDIKTGDFTFMGQN